MKKIFAVSIMAVMAVTAANAQIASKAYVDVAENGTYVTTANTPGENIAALDAQVKANYDRLPADNKTVAQAITTALEAANAGTALQGVQVNSTDLTADANKKVNIAIVEGTTDGAISVNGTAVPVHGLGSAAYTASTAYATAAQGQTADTAVQPADITTGTTNGTIKVGNTEVPVAGLGSAAYTASTAYDAAGTAAGLVGTVPQGYTDVIDYVDSVAGTANGAVQNVAEGSTNGTIDVDGTDVAVHGLGSAAYEDTTAFDAAGTASGLVGTLPTNPSTNAPYTTVGAALSAANTSAGNTYQAKSTANYQMGKSDGTWETMSQGQQDALNSGVTSTKVGGYDTAVSAVNDATTGLANTYAIATAAIPAPSDACADSTNKCVLTSSGAGNYAWEVIARADNGQ